MNDILIITNVIIISYHLILADTKIVVHELAKELVADINGIPRAPVSKDAKNIDPQGTFYNST